MKNLRSVLLVHNESRAFHGLEEALHELEISTRRARRCADARAALQEPAPFDLVLTDTRLADGTWKDVLELVGRSARETPVIVISRVVDTALYLDTQEAGAADFIVPPVARHDLAYVLSTAIARTDTPAIRRPPARARREPRRQPRLP